MVDVRVARSDLGGLTGSTLLGLRGLASVDMCPPTAGPEVELTFGPYGLSAEEAAEQVVVELVQTAGAHVLASRTRTGGWVAR